MIHGPDIVNSFGSHFLLWFAKTNTYSIIDTDFQEILNVYLTSKSQSSFIKSLQVETGFSTTFLKSQYQRIEDYLTTCHTLTDSDTKSPDLIEIEPLANSKYYQIGSKVLEIQYNDQRIQQLFHPLIAHLHINNDLSQPDEHVRIKLAEKKLIMSLNDTLTIQCQTSDYHKIQGKLIMQVINLLHETTDQDWVGLLHASAVSKHKLGILFTGSSGSGKSTLVSLLVSHGFELIADDTVPLRADDSRLYHNPGAVSVKASALSLVSKYWPNESSYTKGLRSKSKGAITYIPMHKDFVKSGADCKYLIKVNYQPNIETEFTEVGLEEVIQEVIRESWISPNAEHAHVFFNWLDKLRFFNLNYSNFKEVIPILEQLTESDR
ncbi:hypothetical protein [Winogradskyella aurantiaca]|uniref:hypothetical protein n=1 Tax=Winogradskyella aurantiaca TaxID=2219558 RepID=UPI000E1E05D6|nr:hypothetical protein [Winogradskyella aurantiaca]